MPENKVAPLGWTAGFHPESLAIKQGTACKDSKACHIVKVLGTRLVRWYHFRHWVEGLPNDTGGYPKITNPQVIFPHEIKYQTSQTRVPEISWTRAVHTSLQGHEGDPEIRFIHSECHSIQLFYLSIR